MKGESFRVLRCPPDRGTNTRTPAYTPYYTKFTRTHLAGLLKDGIAPVGMVMEDKRGDLWMVYHHPDHCESQVLVAVEKEVVEHLQNGHWPERREEYVICTPVRMMTGGYHGLRLEEIGGEE